MRIAHIVNFFNSGGSALACYEAAKVLKQDFRVQQIFLACISGPMRDHFSKLGSTVLTTGGRHHFDYTKEDLQPLCEFSPHIIHIWIPGQEPLNYLKYLPEGTIKVATVLCLQKVGFDWNQFATTFFLSEFNKNYNSQVKNGAVTRCGISLNSDDINERVISYPITLGRISAFCPSKKIHDTIQCASKVDPEKAIFVIAGEILDEKYYQFCKSLSEKHQHISIETNVDNQRKEEIYKSIDILHYPTSNETFCYSILEGMKYGKAIITYNNSAISEFNHDNNLILVESGNLASLQEKTQDLIDNPEKIYSIGGFNREIAVVHYRSEIYGAKIYTEYTRLLGKQKMFG